MKPRPLHFGEASVRANLAGRKTVTRRPMKPQPPSGSGFTSASESSVGPWFLWKPGSRGACFWPDPPRFKPGDIFYMAERIRWQWITRQATDTWGQLEYLADRSLRTMAIPKRVKVPRPANPPKGFDGTWPGRTIPPEWARPWRGIITDVRPEKLGEMTIIDAIQEGVADAAKALKMKLGDRFTSEAIKVGEEFDLPVAVARYAAWWNSIYKTKWHPDTWVWRYEYKEYQNV